MSTARFFKSNSLDFRRLEDYDLLQDDETRLYYDFNYPSIANTCYFTQVLKSKGLWFQFRTDYDLSSITVTVVNEVGTETDITGSITPITTLAENGEQYEVNVNVNLFNNINYIKLSFIEYNKPILNYQSEWFEFKTSIANNYLLTQWNMSSYSTYDDGILWGSKKQHLLIDSRLSDLKLGVDKSIYKNSSYQDITTRSQPLKSKTWQVEPLPAFMMEKLNIAMQHNEFYLNGSRWNSEETFDIERLGDIGLYPSELLLNLVADPIGYAYEDYAKDIELTGEFPVIPDSYSLINDTDFSIINDSGDLNKLNK